MKRRQFILSLAGTAAAGLTGWKLVQTTGAKSFKGALPTGQLVKLSRNGWALGTQVTLTVFHDDQAAAEEALEQAFKEIETVEQVMSLYRPTSQLSQLNRNGRLDNPHPYLVEVLETASALSEQTNGAFDVTVQPLWTLYYTHAKARTEPTGAELQAALAKVDWRRVEISPQQIRLKGDGTEITLNGIAQGFAADAVGRVLQTYGITSALIDTGEIGTVGARAGKDDWSIGIKHPRKPQDFLGLASLNGRCLATSGDYETRFSEDFSQHHLLDPKTGRSPSELSSVSVAAPTALQADALSTAVFLLGLKAGRQLIEATPGTDALFVTKEGQTVRTSGFSLIS